jgi:hypothetical protein
LSPYNIGASVTHAPLRFICFYSDASSDAESSTTAVSDPLSSSSLSPHAIISASGRIPINLSILFFSLLLIKKAPYSSRGTIGLFLPANITDFTALVKVYFDYF